MSPVYTEVTLGIQIIVSAESVCGSAESECGSAESVDDDVTNLFGESYPAGT